MRKKTDNSYLGRKLDLRRYFLRKYHAEGEIRVLDCCQGSGKIWSILRKEFPVTRYWGLDVKPKAGRLKLDSVRILSMPGLSDNVIDIDTYGSPWRHWGALCQTVGQPTTVFLTHGMIRVAGGGASQAEIEALRFGSLAEKTPPALLRKMCDRIGISCCLTISCSRIKIIEAIEALAPGNARYLGVRIEPL